MRRPEDRPAALANRRGDAGAEGQDLPEDGGSEESHGLEDEVDASTPESRRLHALMIEFSRYRSLKNPLAGICEDLQLTPTQMHALSWLGNDGPVQVGVLAQRVGITRKTITGVVDRLESMGLVERTRDVEDRRAVVVRLTQPGSNVFARIDRGLDASLRRVLDLMGPEDRDAVFGILERMLARLTAEAEAADDDSQAG
ncbi:MarR family winged helix-turn-helix transcriptional regulator [Corallococcus macrosporus]|uniref:MarR family transcriptional regulator n=1 Tax=Myxococcus fulvus (strain ATCC BAA-855 / HW-1) TaxID=483219 RepID=F8CK31_MYXFH|nr:MarR family transcriptional regulator [Corallococcus macrosporus]AEI66407.1 MarR family transcriptional regulator [Corallococcus macrosporus]